MTYKLNCTFVTLMENMSMVAISTYNIHKINVTRE
jgi:hypothetical protein